MRNQTFFTKSEKDRERLLAWAREVDLDKPLMISVKKGSKRSIEQNNLYHMWAAIIAGETGDSKAATEEYLKHEFLTPVTYEVRGQVYEVYSTTKLTVGEFSEFLDQIDAFAKTQGWYLPHPEDQHRRNAG